MSSNPKRNPQRREDYSDEEILRADDPRPQRVAQYPTSGARRAVRKADQEAIPTSVFDTEKHDEELRASYGPDADQSFKPVFLYVERGPGAGQLVQVKQGQLVIGRASVSDLRLQHPSISRRHTQVTRTGERFYVKDLGSQNGTFVNKQRIGTEIEIFPDDTVAMGNALLKLRGPLARGEELGKAPPRAPKKMLKQAPAPARPQSSNGLKIAIFGGAVGFGVAVVVAVMLLTQMPGQKPSFKALTTSAGEAKAGSDDPVVALDSTEVKVNDAIERKMAERRAAGPRVDPPASAPASAAAPVASSGNPKPVAVAAVSRSAAKSAADSAFEDDDSAIARPSASSTKGRAAILAPYEKGDAPSSLELAKKASDKDLADKLTKFNAAYEAANDSMSAGQGGPAIRSFEAALKLDGQLSSGASKYGSEIHKQLSKLYTLVGFAHLKNDNQADAKTAFAVALKNDPTNEQARVQLTQVGGSAEPAPAVVVRKKAAPADDGVGDEEAPALKARKPAAKKAEPKSRAQAIDDAFGD